MTKHTKGVLGTKLGMSQVFDADNIRRLNGPRGLLTQDFLYLSLGLFLLRSELVD